MEAIEVAGEHLQALVIVLDRPVHRPGLLHNLAKANNKTDCGEEDPVPSGNGILLLGAADNDISKNLVLGNRGEGVEGLGGGIVLVTGGEPGGPQFEPSGNTVRRNVAFGNQPFDIAWDGTGDDVTFTATAAAPPSREACATDLDQPSTSCRTTG